MAYHCEFGLKVGGYVSASLAVQPRRLRQLRKGIANKSLPRETCTHLSTTMTLLRFALRYSYYLNSRPKYPYCSATTTLNTRSRNHCWVLVKGFSLSYHSKETILIIYYRSLICYHTVIWQLELNTRPKSNLGIKRAFWFEGGL